MLKNITPQVEKVEFAALQNIAVIGNVGGDFTSGSAGDDLI